MNFYKPSCLNSSNSYSMYDRKWGICEGLRAEVVSSHDLSSLRFNFVFGR